MIQKNSGNGFLKILVFYSAFIMGFVFFIWIQEKVWAQSVTPDVASISRSPLPTAGANPSPPTNFKLEAWNGFVRLSWDKVTNVKGYWIYVSKDDKTFIPKNNEPWTDQNIIIPGLENGQKYYFGITSVGLDGQVSKMVVRSAVPNKKVEPPKWVRQLEQYDNENLPPVGRKEYGKWLEKQNLPIIGTLAG